MTLMNIWIVFFVIWYNFSGSTNGFQGGKYAVGLQRCRLYANEKSYGLLDAALTQACPVEETFFARFTSLVSKKLYMFGFPEDTGHEEDVDAAPMAVFNSGASLILCVPILSNTSYIRYVYSKDEKILPDQSNILGSLIIRREREHYTLPDVEHGSHRELRLLRKTCPLAPDLMRKYLLQLQFNEAYRVKNSVNWNHYFGELGARAATSHHMWQPGYIGHVHQVHSNAYRWHKNEFNDEYVQNKEPVRLDLETVSLSPKVFVIRNFLSSHEADCLIDLARSEIEDSVLLDGSGGSIKKSKVRLSKNTWISRDRNAITDTIYRRAADLFQISEQKVRDFVCAEQMQVVNYQVGGKFDYHYDWFINHKDEASKESGESRFLTLLLYLNDKADKYAGGETGFYHGEITDQHDAHNLVSDGIISAISDGKKQSGFKVHPGKGGAVLFYNLLEDGNGDVRSQHSGMPVKFGEKWVANLWVWDPIFA